MEVMFISALTQLVAHTKSQPLCCDLLVISGQQNGTAGHKAMGIYKIEDELAWEGNMSMSWPRKDRHCVYVKVPTVENPLDHMYLYHRGSGEQQQWIIGSSVGASSGRLYVNSGALQPTAISNGWWASGESQWQVAPNISVNCSSLTSAQLKQLTIAESEANATVHNPTVKRKESGDKFLDRELVAFKGVHFGCAPWLRPNGLDWNNPRNVQHSLEDCEAQCRSIKGCRYGTYMEHGERRGECWLAAQTAPQTTQCGTVLGNAVEICTGFHLNVDEGNNPPPTPAPAHLSHVECEADHYFWGTFKSKPLCVTCAVGRFSTGCGPPPKQFCHPDRYGNACKRLPDTSPNVVTEHRKAQVHAEDATSKHCEISSSYGDWSKCSQECGAGKKYRYKEMKRYGGVCGASGIRSHTIIQTSACTDRLCATQESQSVRYRHVTVPSIRLSAALPTDKEHTSVVGMTDTDQELASLGEPIDSHIGPGTTYTVTNMQEPD